MLSEISLKIRRRETPFYEKLYRIAKTIRSFEIPAFRPLYKLLSAERTTRLKVWRNFTRIFYHTPIFKMRCDVVGKRLRLLGGVPLVMGHLRLVLGDDVLIHGYSTFVGAKVFESPTLTVGDNSHLGYQMIISVGCDVTIGKNVLIGDRVSILSYDGHPANPAERHMPAGVETSKPVVVEDNVWIGSNCTILKGVQIGEGSVIANGSVVTMRVPANSMAIGNPARVFPLML